MNPRERLLKTLSGEIPDRIPISPGELYGYVPDSFVNHEPSYANLMKIIRDKTEGIFMWHPPSSEKFLLSSYPVNMEVKTYREGNATVVKRTLHTPKGVLTATEKTIDNIYTTWTTERWCKNIEDVEKALSVPYEPVKYDFSDFEKIKNKVGDNGIIMISIADPLVVAAQLMEFGEYTVWAFTETKHFTKVVSVMHERIMENLKRLLEMEIVDLYRIVGPEYATPPYLPPEFFKRFVVPYVSEMVDLIHSKGGKVRIHCHGKINKVLDMILDTGADAIDPCEGPPDGDITLAEVKKRVGDKMCIFGNIELKLLEHGTPDEVEKTVIDCMNSAKEGGRYVIMPTAAPINAPLSKKTEENYIRYIEIAMEYGKYQ